MTPHPLRVVAVISLGHSGSTLLDLLISSHKRIVSVGEIQQLSPHYDGPCTCGAESLWACSFWSDVDGRLREGRLALKELDVNSERSDVFRRDNLAAFRAVSEASGCSCIVDSSKSLRRLLNLARLKEIDLRVIQLERTAFGVVYSHMKKGRGLAREAARWSRHLTRMRVALRPLNPLCVDYTDLAENPEATLRRVMQYIGHDFCPSQLEWTDPAAGPRHNIDGNRMRFSTDGSIRPDTKWQAALSARQKALIGFIVGAHRLLHPLLYLHALVWRKQAVCKERS